MEINSVIGALPANPEYYVGGFSFLGIIVVGMRLLWKLQTSGEAIYERRAERQNETIERLDASIEALRKDTEACHKERAQQAVLIATLQTQVEYLTQQVALGLVNHRVNEIDIASNAEHIETNATKSAEDSANVAATAENTKVIADNTKKL